VIEGATPRVIVAPGTLWAVAYAADTGRELWRVAGLPNEVCASPVTAGGLIYATGWTPGAGVQRMPEFESLREAGDRDGDGRLSREEAPAGPAQQHFHYMDADRDGLLTREEYTFIAGVFGRSRNAALALRPPPVAASVPVTAEVVWSHTRGLPYVATPLVHRGRLYLLKNGGLLTCLNATNGAVLFQEERLGILGDNYASPVAAGDQVVVISQTGAVAVLAAGDTLDVRARNVLGERVLATPAIAEDTLFIRSESHLWAFRETR
jgi:outer membrane protein assembly factor BamB